MTRRILLLNGLAILAVVCNHAVGWGYTAMFWWTDSYRPVTTPNFDQLGTLPYYVLLAIQQLAFFSVPAFLFVSGFFIAYAARGSQSALNSKVVQVRIRDLLVPYAIWSGVIFLGDALQGVIYAPVEYLASLAFGRATPAYFYVPLLCQFFLLSPLVAPIAKTRGKQLLLGAALLQLSTIALRYLAVCRLGTPVLAFMIRVTPDWSFTRWVFFFAFGVVSGLHIERLKQWLARFKWSLLLAVILWGTLAIFETEVVSRTTGTNWDSPLKISSSLYAVAFILCFLRFYEVSIPFSRTLYQLGSKSYGIYLLHPKVLEFVARFIRKAAPWMLAQQILFQPVLIVLAVGGSLLFMASLARSPARRAYRYLFG